MLNWTYKRVKIDMQDEDVKPPVLPAEPTRTDESEGVEPLDGNEIPRPTNADFIRQIIAKITASENILVTLSRNPSVDEIASAVGLALFLEESGKHITAIYSGETPNVLEFLKPEETFEDNTDSLQDFIIALNKEKADHLRYKVDGDYVKVFITPYKSKIDQNDLEFSHGDYNVDLVIALNVPTASDLDAALSEHGRIMHDASAIDITTGEPGRFGEIEWSNPESSSVGEMVADLLMAIKKPEIKPEVATALLAAMMAATNRFANENTKSTTMTMAAKLMELGADQQLVAINVMENNGPELIGAVDMDEANKKKAEEDKTLLTVEHENSKLEDAIKEAVESAKTPDMAKEAEIPEETKSNIVTEVENAPAEPTSVEESPKNAEEMVPEVGAVEAGEVKAPTPEASVPEVPAPETSASEATPEVVGLASDEAQAEAPGAVPESDMVMPEVIEPTTGVVPEPELASVTPESTSTDAVPEPISTDITSEPASAEPEPVLTEPESASMESGPTLAEPKSVSAEPESVGLPTIPAEPKPEMTPPMPATPPDYSQMMSEALAESIPGEVAAEPMPIEPITSGSITSNSGTKNEKVDNDLESPEMASEPAALRDDSYVFNQEPKVVEPLPDLPPPPIPPIDFGATPSDQPALPQMPGMVTSEPVATTPSMESEVNSPDVTAEPSNNALEQLQQMATPAQAVEAPTLPPIESVPGAVVGAEPAKESAAELTPDVPPQPMNEPESTVPDAFQIPNFPQ